jgi:predicted PurR-regulated permease PerM
MTMDAELVREARQIDDSVVIDLPPDPAHRVIVDVKAMTIVKILAILFVASLLTEIWPLITLIALAVMLATALAPYLAVLEHRGVSRPWALTIVATTLIAAFAALVAVIVPGLVIQTRDLITNSDSYARSLQLLLAQHGIHANLVRAWHSVPAKLSSLNSTFLDAAVALINSLIAMATVVFLTLYLLSDQERIKAFFVGMFPAGRRPHVLMILAELRRQVGGYVRGQLITSGLAAVFSFIVLTLAGVPNALTLSVYVGVADLVPMFGQLLGTIPSVLIALTISPLRAAIVLGGFVLYQQLENHLIVPRVYSKTMRVSPLVALVALLVGAKLLGMLGMLVALPVVAALPVILDFAGIHVSPGDRPAPEPDAAKDVEPA